MRKWFWIAVLAVSTAQAARLGEVQYVPPIGWQAHDVSATEALFRAPDVPAGEFASIVVALKDSGPGDLRAGFQAAVGATLNGKRTLQSAPVTAARTPQGFDVVAQNLTALDGARRVLAQFAGVDLHGRMLLVALLTSSDEVQRTHQRAIAEFIQGIQLAPVAGHARPGMISGNIYDQRGRLLHIEGGRVEVHVWGAGAGGDRNGFTIAADANGHYESRLPHGLYGFHARAYLPLNGSVVCVDLEPMDGQPAHIAVDSTPGIVKDFMLKLTGPVAGGDPHTIQGYYGGSVTLTDGVNWKEPYFNSLAKKYPGGKVVLAMEPLGAAIDGSRVAAQRLEFDLQKIQPGEHRAGIPLAGYRVTATLVTADGRSRPMRIAMLPNLNYQGSVEVLYRPDRDDHDGRPEKPNLLVID